MRPKHMRPGLLTALCSTMMIFSLLILAACSGGATSTPGTGSTSGGKNPADIHLGFVTETSSLNFASEMAAGAQYAANQYHVKAQIVAPPNIDDQAAVKLFQDLTRTSRDGIAVETLAPDLFARPEADAVRAGIPIIAVDTVPVAGTNITTYVGNDNVGAGAMLADAAIQRLPKDAKGSVIIGIDTPGVPVLVYRSDGMKQAFKQARPDLQVLGPFDSKQEPQQNFDAWNNLIKAHPDAVAYLGVGDADNASLARLKQANHGKYLTAAFDLNPVGLQAVANGVNYAILDPEHFLKGYVAMRLLIEHALQGKAIPTGWWNTGSLLITQDNVQDIIKRQQSLDTKGKFYQPIIDKQFANPSAQIKPLDQAK
ncbi:sugar ABC transporter substrate-binding protein [Ktedonosporobacter rubrisoli]|uniref:Sugar ABC transporter substrate-binding protein n=1 Tax=Ktedonosporobacter rubrisoli TaxID=2509675 RepID=A0A4P6JN15_KTERU|nr:sugar ABC transporter substrate-binding protein [Ktedonosporobacter rubrisoli]QBD76678.1 sugar ABC transporter substrate-binding protein [Ktedonosporobacter rubrisoli]